MKRLILNIVNFFHWLRNVIKKNNEVVKSDYIPQSTVIHDSTSHKTRVFKYSRRHHKGFLQFFGYTPRKHPIMNYRTQQRLAH